MKIKTLLIVSAIGIALATPESLQAQAKPKPVKPDVGDVKDDAKERPKFDVEKIKERLKTAFEKRKKNRGDAKKHGHKVKGKGGKGMAERSGNWFTTTRKSRNCGNPLKQPPRNSTRRSRIFTSNLRMPRMTTKTACAIR